MEGTSRASGATARAPRDSARARRTALGSLTTTSVTPRARRAAMARAPMGPAPLTRARWPGTTAARVTACSATARGSARAAARRSSPSGTGTTAAWWATTWSAKAPRRSSPRRAPCAAQRRAAAPTPRAGAAGRLGPAHHGVADAHEVDVGPEVDDPARPLVATDRARAPPALEGQVEVGAADAAVAHLDQHLARPGRRGRPGLHPDVAGPVEHRRTGVAGGRVGAHRSGWAAA